METQQKELILTRILNAPRELAFKAWTDPVHLAKWWGPKDFTNPVCRADARPGGKIYIDMTGPDGTVYPTTGHYEAIDEPNSLVLITKAFEDEHGIAQLEVRNTITFEDIDGKTRLTLHAVVLKATPELAQAVAGMATGWSQSLDRLVALAATL